MSDKSLNDYEQKLIRNVAEHGWFGLSVVGGAYDFTYTIGFWETLQKPELIVCGLPVKLAQSVLWEAFRQIKAGTRTVADGERWSDLLADFDCVSRPVHPTHISREHFNSALWYRRFRLGKDDGFSAFQLFWPSAKSGLFQWEAGCEPGVERLQPVLYSPKKSSTV